MSQYLDNVSMADECGRCHSSQLINPFFCAGGHAICKECHERSGHGDFGYQYRWKKYHSREICPGQ